MSQQISFETFSGSAAENYERWPFTDDGSLVLHVPITTAAAPRA
jgi:hypothetical protein